MAALLIVVGLAVSVPPSFGTAEGDHFGLLLHPLFPHAHGGAGSAFTPDNDSGARGEFTTETAPIELRQLDPTPVIHGQVSDEGFRSALSGIVLPMLLAGVLLHFRQFEFAAARRYQQHWRGPPRPPPRALAPVVVTY